MSSNVKFDDLTQPIFFIPHSEPEGEQEDDSFYESDLVEGEDLRWDAYRAAWSKCLNRVQDIIKTIYEPVIANVVQSVSNTYETDFTGLPYPELPVIALTSPSPFPTFIQQVIERLNIRNKRQKPNCYVTHLFPAECTNMVGTMKALITGFTNQGFTRSKGFRSTGRTLAAYDIKVLETWYRDLVEDPKKRTQLIVILHDFEQFDSSIIQDLTYICSQQSRTLPLVFILCISSPFSPTYLHTSYPHSTLALLHIQQYLIPSGHAILEAVILDTFANLHYDPTLFLGPVMLEAIIDQFVRYDSSADSLMKSLQLAHLKHFSINSLTLLHHHTPSHEVFRSPSSFPFLDSLLSRLHGLEDEDEDLDWQTKSIRDVIRAVDTARSDFYAQTRRVRLAFGLMRSIQEFLEENGYKGLDLEVGGDLPKYIRIYLKVLRGRVVKDINDITRYLRLLNPQQASAFMTRLRTFLQSLPDNVDVAEAVADAEELMDEHVTDDLFTDEEGLKEIIDKAALWLSKYLKKWTGRLNERTLWEIWYTGDAPFPSETINPSVRASIMSGLLRPNEFVSSNEDGDQPEFELWECPDTSILFHRYLESGKMINVYDWFESFHVVLETQRKKLEEKRMAAAFEERRRATTMPIPLRTPRKHNSPKKYGTSKKANDKTPSRRRGKEAEGLVPPPPVKEVDEEGWDMQVQARFIRALHELDYMGFIKHTKRKQDSVLRTIFDVSG
ncbi:hypothetical protein E1B28_006509 [Marasmius oreades]|uniref:Origin recognition complex subunit 3 n=1 Tax=Marasmius oreades TaxID=181124 RepID=A0A9P7UWE6_9AGAR|nr:uncharacterized protein E1B28_006509 [Marasmius oreades]KAG7095809.1 hypothetical protein E1B28_006509 [Marasmius oreades]